MKSHVILGVFAHPDDEVIIAPLLATCASAGAECHLAFATSGDKGAGPNTDLPAGDELAQAREEEGRQACAAYGIHEPFYLRRGDGTLAGMSPPELTRLDNDIADLIRRLKPSTIITFGPGGYTGHSDHKAVSNVVTDLFLRWDAGSGFAPDRLYYPCFPASAHPRLPESLSFIVPVADRFITTEFDASPGLDRAARGVTCYQTQFSPQYMASVDTIMRDIFCGKIYLRSAHIGNGGARGAFPETT